MTPTDILGSTSHRPWPVPNRPWIGVQIWHDLLFAHWPVSAQVLRPLVPSQLPLDTYDGQCWVGIVPFHMSGVRARGMPPVPGLSAFPELNVRTYVTLENKPGVYFFSLDAGNLPAVWGARAFFHLPYFYARMRLAVREDEVNYYSNRLLTPAELKANYRPVSPVQLRSPGTLDHWLTERYCLYTVWRKHVYRCDIHHLQWPLQDGEAEIERNTMARAAGIALPASEALLHFSQRQEVLIWPLQRL
jgi:uncharacterized protein YqjF (DUF2071 family)